MMRFKLLSYVVVDFHVFAFWMLKYGYQLKRISEVPWNVESEQALQRNRIGFLPLGSDTIQDSKGAENFHSRFYLGAFKEIKNMFGVGW